MSNETIHPETTLVVKANYSSLEEISDFVQGHAETSGLSFKKTWEVMLALDELCCSTISHIGSDDDELKLKILWKQHEKGVTIQISDNGPPFNPLRAAPDEKEVLEENKRLGGMGPYLIEKMLDEIAYKRINGHNVLVLTKNKHKRKG